MSLFKGMLKHSCLDFGWSELHWLSGTDLNAAAANLKAINGAGMPMRPANVTLVDAQIVDAEDPGVSYHPDLSTWALAGTYAVASTTITPNLAIMFRLNDTVHEHRSRIYFRGFPSNQFASGTGGPDLLFTFTADYGPLMNAYSAAVIANALMAHRTAPHTYDIFPINTCVQSLSAHLRRAGRPFGLPRGRRTIA